MVGVNIPLQLVMNVSVCYRQLCLNNKDSLYSDRVSYGTVTLVAANTDLRLPLARDALSSAREGRVLCIMRVGRCREPSVSGLTGGGE